MNINNITYDHAKKQGCLYCNLRHSNCGYPDPWDEDLNWIECEHFVLGKCFDCIVRKQNNGEFVPGVCADIFDFSGCDNFKEK